MTLEGTQSRTMRFYTKPGCHLCEEAWPGVERVAARHGVSVWKVNIEEDPALFERHQHRIPVVELEGKELAWGRISEKGLEQALGKLFRSL